MKRLASIATIAISFLTLISSPTSGVAADCLDALLPKPQVIERTGGVAPKSVFDHVSICKARVLGALPRTDRESYGIRIFADGITVWALCADGERHAQTTLRQLKGLATNDLPCCEIRDWPRFPYRGLMLDCGRNFQSLDSVREIIDFMAKYKMNLFHWHLTDYYGWRLESKKYPQLQSDKAFGRHVGKYYTQKEFCDLVEFAAARGVTVMPEIDLPGHTLAFRRAFGIDRMDSPGVEKIVLDLIEELCSLVPAEKMPLVHLGTDEVNLEGETGSNPVGNPEGVPHEWLERWGAAVTASGRVLLGWHPGENLTCAGPKIRETWGFTQSREFRDRVLDLGERPYLDSTDTHYIDNSDPLEALAGAAFQQPCRWGPEENKMGVMISAWHDDAIGRTEEIERTLALYPSIVLYADSFWRGREQDEPELHGRLPSPGDPRFSRAVDLERRVLIHRDTLLKDLPHPFQFVKQTDLRWRMSDQSGKVLHEDIAQATIRPFWENFAASAMVATGRTNCVVLETRVHSPCRQQVGAWIGFTAPSRSAARLYAPTAQRGEWNEAGAKAFLNGRELSAPQWNNPGAFGVGAYEIPLSDEDYFYRAPLPIDLREGWNDVKLIVPDNRPGNWVATFMVISGTSAHPREVPGLTYTSHVGFVRSKQQKHTEVKR